MIMKRSSKSKKIERKPTVEVFSEDRTFIKIEAIRRGKTIPEFINALLEVYKKHFKV